MLDWFSQMPPELGLGGVFLSAFLSATLLPGNSELVLAGWLYLHPTTLWPAVLLASLGNTLGGLTTFWLGGRLRRASPQRMAEKLSPRALNWLQQHGSPSLMLSWVPLIGDGLCLAAGWLRLPPLPAVLWMLLGKGLRYLILALSLQASFPPG